MKTSVSIFLLVLLATFLGCAANLQRPDIQEQPLAPGDRIRVSVSDAQDKQFFVRPLVALDADTLFLKNQIALPLSSVTKLEVYRGRKSNGLIGAGIGALVGAGFGAVAGFLSGDNFFLSAEDKAVVGALAWGLIGGTIGAQIGANIKSDHWEEVPLEKVRMSLRR